MLKDIVTSSVRVKIIMELFKELDSSIHIRELARRVGTEINAVRRELDRLQKCGMLKKETRANRIYFSVRKDYPGYKDMLSFVYKEIGIGGLVLKNLSELGKVKFGILSTEFIEGRVSSPNEVDLLLVGTIDMNYLQELIKKVQDTLEHEINYTVLGEDEFSFRKSRRDSFILNILIQGRIVIIGDESKFCRVS